MGLLTSDEVDDPETAGFNEADGFTNHGSAKRVVDEEAGVVLYGLNHKGSFSMTAIPIDETDLEIDDGA